MQLERRKRPFRYLGRIIDVINIVLSVIVLSSAIFVAMDRENNMMLFPVIFICTALINLALAIKYFKRKEGFRFCTLMAGFIIFTLFAIFSLVIVM